MRWNTVGHAALMEEESHMNVYITMGGIRCMNRPVIVFTSWNRHATNGRAMLAPINVPQEIPSVALS